MICYEEYCRDPDAQPRLVVSGRGYLEAMKKFLSSIAIERPVFLVEYLYKLKDMRPLTEIIKYRGRKLSLGKDVKIPLRDIVERLEKNGVKVSEENFESEIKAHKKYFGAYSILKLRNAIGELRLDRGVYYLDTRGLGRISTQRFIYSLSKLRDDFIFIHVDFPVIVHESVPRIVSNIKLNVPAVELVVEKPTMPQKIVTRRERRVAREEDVVKASLRELAELLGLKPRELKLLELEGLPYNIKYKHLLKLGLAERKLNRLIGKVVYVTSLAFGLKKEVVREKLEEL